MKKQYKKWYILFGVVILILLAFLCMYPTQTIKVLFGLGLGLIVLMSIFNWIMGKTIDPFEKSFKKQEEEHDRFRHP